MSALDEAFLKAYGKGRARSRAAASLAGAKAPQVGPVLDHRHTGVPHPHINLARTSAAATEAESEMPREAVPTAPKSGFRPAYEVPQFLWPSLIGELVASRRAQLGEACELLTKTSHSRAPVLLVASAARGEGCTTVTLALAYVAARRGLRTALVDIDLQQPELADRLGVVVQLGAEEVYRGHCPVSEALIESMAESVSLLALGSGKPGRRGFIPGKVGKTLSTLSEHYGLVLADVGALDGDGAAIDLAGALASAAVDGVILVEDPARTSSAQREAVERRLTALTLGKPHVVANFVRSRREVA